MDEPNSRWTSSYVGEMEKKEEIGKSRILYNALLETSIYGGYIPRFKKLLVTWSKFWKTVDAIDQPKFFFDSLMGIENLWRQHNFERRDHDRDDIIGIDVIRYEIYKYLKTFSEHYPDFSNLSSKYSAFESKHFIWPRGMRPERVLKLWKVYVKK